MSKKILITGANGFIGRALCRHLVANGLDVVATVRQGAGLREDLSSSKIVQIETVTTKAEWQNILAGCDAVVHLAGRAHVMAEKNPDPLAEYRKVNVEMTGFIAEAAAAAGVRRFVYLSSIKVGGEKTKLAPIGEDHRPRLDDPYSISKAEAENKVIQICAGTGMEYVVVRPPLVYGPGVKANFAKLMKLVGYKLPLPLAAVANARSMVGINNLVDFISCCLEHPAAGGEIFNVSDDEDLSTPELIRRTGAAMGLRSTVFPIPEALLKWSFALLGQGKAGGRLIESLRVDITKAKEKLAWQPPYTTDQEIAKTVQWYVEHRKR